MKTRLRVESITDLEGRMSPIADRAHVLFVEDDEATRRAVAPVLAGAGHRVTSASTGVEALALVRSVDPDLVLLDVRAPDGLDVCRGLKADSATASIPILVLSASPASEHPVMGAEGGADMVLARPVEPPVLVAALKALLRARRAEARVRRLVDSNVAGIAEVDPSGAVLDANDEYLRILGHERAQLEAGVIRWEDHILPDRAAAVERARDEFRRTGEVQPYETELRRGDGGRIPVLAGIAAIHGGRGIVFLMDLTGRKRAEREREEALARAEAAQGRLALLLSVTSAVMGEPGQIVHGLRRLAELCAGSIADWCIVDRVGPNGRIERVAVAVADPVRQPAAEALTLQAPAAEGAIGRALATGRAEALADVRDPSDLDPPREDAARAALEALGVRTASVHPLLARGQVLGALTLVRSWRSGEPSPIDVALGEEIAGRAAVALESARLHEELSRALRARDDVLTEVSHDLRNPLASVLLGAVQLERAAERPDVADVVRRRAGSIRRAGDRMNRLVNDLLDLARMESGRLAIDVEDHGVAEILGEGVETAAAPARDRGVSIEISVDPALRIRCDRERVVRVLANLLANSIRASPRGGRIQVSARPRPDGIAVSVHDDGRGIPREEQEHLFERYWRGREAGGSGVGLGLSISKALVERHGGRIWVESERGQGATFTFTIPAELPPGDDPGPA